MATMLLDINMESPIPIYEQIVTQVIFAVASGGLEPGTLIPGVRELAPQLRVHPNTVAKAYQDLVRRQVIVARRGKGMEVTPEAPQLCRAARQDTVRKRIRAALREAVSSALTPEEIQTLMQEEFSRVNGVGN